MLRLRPPQARVEPKSRSHSTRATLVLGALIAVACGQPDLVDRGGPDTNDATFAENAEQVRFLALGDFGTGEREQKAVAKQMCAHHEEEPFAHVVSTGDNVYATGEPGDFDNDFYVPYSCLFDRGVRFHAVLGNHDIKTLNGEAQIGEPRFGMLGRYYTWKLGPVTFIMFDSQALDVELDTGTSSAEDSQYQWLLQRLAEAQDDAWTVVVFHDPVYSTGVKHPSKPEWDIQLAQPFADAGVDLVLNGHDHNYQSAEDDGVTYIVTGGGGAELYRCDLPAHPPVDTCLERYHYVEVEAGESSMSVTALSETGEILEILQVSPND
jgi:predicted phosphodiesterase